MTRLLLLAASLAALSGCSTLRIRTEQAGEADLERLRTWGWRASGASGGPGTGDEPRVHDPASRALIEGTVERELAARGLRRVELAAGPDVLVDYFGWSQDRTDVSRTGTGMLGSEYSYDPGVSSASATRVQTVRDVTLIVDFIDPSTGRRLWRGTATDSVEARAHPGFVKGAVAGILARFPIRRP